MFLQMLGISFRRWFGLDRGKPDLPLKDQEYFLVSIDPADIHEDITETELALKLYSKLSDSINNEQSAARNQDFSEERTKHIDDTNEKLNVFQKVGKTLSKLCSQVKKFFRNDKNATEIRSDSIIKGRSD